MATLNLPIASGNHDSDEIAAGTIGLNDNTITLTAGGHWGLLYWASIGLPVGAIVSAANLDVFVVNTSNDDPNVDFYLEASDSPAAPSTTGFDISNRPRTTAKKNWSASSVGSGYKTIDILLPFQEWAARPGRTASSNCAVIIDSIAGSNLQIVTYDDDPAEAAILVVTYTLPGSFIRRRTRTYLRL